MNVLVTGGGGFLGSHLACRLLAMGHFVSGALDAGNSVLHFNGSYHSDDFEGILYYILLRHPDIEFATISTVMQENVRKLEEENKGKASFILCIDENMTPTY